MKFQLLIKTKISANKEVSCFKSLRGVLSAMGEIFSMPVLSSAENDSKKH